MIALAFLHALGQSAGARGSPIALDHAANQ